MQFHILYGLVPDGYDPGDSKIRWTTDLGRILRAARECRAETQIPFRIHSRMMVSFEEDLKLNPDPHGNPDGGP